MQTAQVTFKVSQGD